MTRSSRSVKILEKKIRTVPIKTPPITAKRVRRERGFRWVQGKIPSLQFVYILSLKRWFCRYPNYEKYISRFKKDNWKKSIVLPNDPKELKELKELEIRGKDIQYNSDPSLVPTVFTSEEKSYRAASVRLYDMYFESKLKHD